MYYDGDYWYVTNSCHLEIWICSDSILEEKHPYLHSGKSWTKYDYDEEIRTAIHHIYSYFKKKYGWGFELVERAFKLLWEDRVKTYCSQVKRKLKRREEHAKHRAREVLAEQQHEISRSPTNSPRLQTPSDKAVCAPYQPTTHQARSDRPPRHRSLRSQTHRASESGPRRSPDIDQCEDDLPDPTPNKKRKYTSYSGGNAVGKTYTPTNSENQPKPRNTSAQTNAHADEVPDSQPRYAICNDEVDLPTNRTTNSVV